MSKDVGESVPSGGTEVQPEQKVSPTTEVQPTSPDAGVSIEDLWKRVEAQDAQLRALQGDKDRGVNRALQEVESLSERLRDLEPYVQARIKGKNPEDAENEFILNQMINERKGVQPAAKANPGKVEPKPVDANLDDYFAQFGIDPNEPDTVEFIRAGKFDEVSKTRFVLDRSKKPTVEPSAAGSLPDGMGATMGTRTLEVVEAELNAMLNSPVRDFGKQKELEEEHRKLLNR